MQSSRFSVSSVRRQHRNCTQLHKHSMNFPVACSIFFMVCSHGVAAQPLFPPGVDETLSNMDRDSSSVDMHNPDEPQVLKSMEDRASSSLQADLAEAEEESALYQAAYIAARVRVLKSMFSGGCARDFQTSCPAGWVENDGVCSPPDTYEGRCGDVASSELSNAADKESFSWKCRAEWPCRPACKRYFSTCPEGWTHKGNMCAAPAAYDGICSPLMDFATYSTADKIQWGTLCGVEWPCK